jgi:basic amino acid/polyamine antiporter, APA family
MAASTLFARKPIARILAQAEANSEHGLRRTLSASNLMFIGVGAIIGAGIFVLTGQAAAQYAGPAIVYSFVLSGIACGFAALCYAEFASMIPVAGSAYTYAYATLGQFVAWLIGWDLILEYTFGSAFVSVGWSGYVVSFLKDFGIIVPPALCRAPLDYVPEQGLMLSGSILNLTAALFVLCCTLIVTAGIRESTRVTNAIVFVKLAVLALFVFFGMRYVNFANWSPFLPENTGQFGTYGWSGVTRGAAVVFLAYLGFDCVSTLAQEAKNPQRDMPIGILGSLAICTVCYITVALVMTGIVHYSALNVPDPIAVAVNAAGESLFWLRPVVKIGAIVGLSSVVLVLLMSQPRIFYTMGCDGLLPPSFAKIHPRFRTPHIPSLITGAVVMFIAAFFPLGLLGELVSIGALLAFIIVCLGVLILRYTDPAALRPFRTPFAPVVCILGALTAAVQMYALPTDTWIRLVVWTLLGLAIYFSYGRKHATL